MGALLSGLATVLASAFRPSPPDTAGAQLQAQKMQNATQMATAARQAAQRSEEVQLGAVGESAGRQQQAMAQLVDGFRKSLLGRVGR